MRFVRRVLLALLLLVPLATLFHRDDTGRWTGQHSAMAGPDEFSYLLMADQFLHRGLGGGLSLKQTYGFDTFYPPGFPLLIAGWTRFFFGGHLTAFAAHALNACLIALDAVLVYLLATRMLLILASVGHVRHRLSAGAARWLALVVAGVFVTNWHVLECALLIMSEPAFMLVVFAWLLLALRWPRWRLHLGQTAVLALLATAAWSIRGAGITCVAATFLCALIFLVRDVVRSRARAGLGLRILSLAVIVIVAVLYQGVISIASPEKSLLAGKDNHNSYPQQLMHGLTHGNELSFDNRDDYPRILANLRDLVGSHLDDFGSAFVPWPRENPDLHARDIIGKLFCAFALLGWTWSMLERFATRRTGGGGTAGALFFADVFLAVYIGLYLIWPFDFARFWSPIVPLMLVYAADALVRFSEPRRRLAPSAVALSMLTLLFTLDAIEDAVQLHNYARRLDYVSDALARSAQVIVRRSPDPSRTFVTVMGGDDVFALAWYFSQAPGLGGDARAYIPRAPGAWLAPNQRAPDSMVDLLRDALNRARAIGNPPGRVYLFSYFAQPDAAYVLGKLQKEQPGEMADVVLEKIFQKEIVAAVYELRVAPRAVVPEGAPDSRAAQPP